MKTWWLWRLAPHPKRMLGEIGLPWSYLADDDPVPHSVAPSSYWTVGYPATFAFNAREGLDLLEAELARRNLPTNGHVWAQPIGAMRALRIDASRPGKRRPGPDRGGLGEHRGRGTRYTLWLTPPVEQFLDAKKHLPDDTLRYGAPALDRERRYTYWIQPEVFAATGEFLAGTGAEPLDGALHDGSLDKTHRVVNVRDTQKVIDLMQEEGETNEVGNLILVALDAFLERNAPDPRFNHSLPARDNAGEIQSPTAQVLAERTERCDDLCPGWAIFDVDREPGVEIEACDECNLIARDMELPQVSDDDVAELAEAQAALRARG